MSAPLYPSPRYTNRPLGFATQLLTIAATTTLVWNDPGTNEVQLSGRQLYVTASGAARILVLPSINVSTNARGLELSVTAISNAVTVKTTGSAATITVIPAGNTAIITMYSNTVYGAVMSSGTANFGAAGILTDVVAESTAAAGVTIDGLLLKDGFVVATDNQGFKLGTGVDDTVSHDGTNSKWVHTTGDLWFDQQAVAGAYLFDMGSDTANSAFKVRNNSLTERFSVNGLGNVFTTAALAGTGDGLWAQSTMSHATQSANGIKASLAQITNVRTAGTLAAVRAAITSLSGSTAGTDVYGVFAEVTAGEATVDHFAFGHGAGFDYSFDFSAAATGEAGAFLAANKANAWRFADSTGTVFSLATTTGLLSMDFPDNVKVRLGTGYDDLLVHDGSNSSWTHTTGDLTFENTAVTGALIQKLGTATSATSFKVLGSANAVLFKVDGAGAITAGAGMWTGCPSPADPAVTTHIFFDDFLTFDVLWTVTEDDAADTQAASDIQNGAVTLTQKATTDDDASQITWANETFKITSGKKLWFEARVRFPAADVTNQDWFIGICEAEDLTGVADNMPANGIGFHKDDGSTTIKCSSSDGGTDTQNANVGTIVSNTWTKLGFVFNGGASGVGSITPYVDGVAGTAVICTYATMAEHAAMFMLRNGDNVTTQIMNIDYVKIVAER